MDIFPINCPSGRKDFTNFLGNSQITPVNQLICDTLFQIIHLLIRDLYNPFVISSAEVVHVAPRSKDVITLRNKLEVLTGYSTMKRIYYSLLARIIQWWLERIEYLCLHKLR